MDYFKKKEEVRNKIKRLRESISNVRNPKSKPGIPLLKCDQCGSVSYEIDLKESIRVCPKCGFHMKMSAMDRLSFLMDSYRLIEFEKEEADPLDFPNYKKKKNLAREQSGLDEAVILAKGEILGEESYIFIMESSFLMASMGLEVGKRIAYCFDMAREESLPVIGFSASGGARMQEGIYSLMQMANTSFAVREHSEDGNLYISFLTDPTTGGVSASFANLGDIILAEPKARICFTGRRVIEQTIREELPESFQSSEFLFEHGFLDDIVERKNQKVYLSKLLRYHRRKNDC